MKGEEDGPGPCDSTLSRSGLFFAPVSRRAARTLMPLKVAGHLRQSRAAAARVWLFIICLYICPFSTFSCK